jgi:tetratricopeptide (TPR) repeat protein
MMNQTDGTALANQAREYYQAEEWQHAADTFLAAEQAFQQAGDVLNCAEMANNRSVVYLRADLPHEALLAVQGTPEVFAAQGDKLREAMAVGNLAAALEAVGDLDLAEETYQEAIGQLRDLKENEILAETLQALSQLQLKRGKAIDAVSSMQSGLESRPKRGLKERIFQGLLKLPFRLTGR